MSENSEAINEFTSYLNIQSELASIITSQINPYLTGANVQPLRIISARYGSTAAFDLLGLGKVFEELRNIVKDISWRGKHEKELSEKEREQAAIGVEAQKAQIEKTKLENEQMLLEIADKKLDLIQKAANLQLPDKDREVILLALIPKLMTITEESTPLLPERSSNIQLLPGESKSE